MKERNKVLDSILNFADIVLDAETFELSASNTVRLSVKEFELMQALVKNAGHLLGVEYLLGHIWHDEAGIDINTVELYVSYLRGKLKWVGSNLTVEGVGSGEGSAFRICAPRVEVDA